MREKRKSEQAASGTERLQKVLARCGVASRRESERIIEEGRVSVDGEVVTELGVKVDPARSRIEVDGTPVRAERKVCFLFHKPRGVLSTNAPSADKRRIIDFFAERRERLYPVGRLDADSEGLILVTNDGELANRLAHPRYEVPKTYRVLVKGRVDERVLKRLHHGVFLSEGKTGPAAVRVTHRAVRESVLELTIHEGRYREVRRMLAALGHPVMRLRRIAIGGLRDPKLRAGQWRPVNQNELAMLRAAARPPADKRPPKGTKRRAKR